MLASHESGAHSETGSRAPVLHDGSHDLVTPTPENREFAPVPGPGRGPDSYASLRCSRVSYPYCPEHLWTGSPVIAGYLRSRNDLAQQTGGIAWIVRILHRQS